MPHDFLRGHEIELIDNVWVYSDTKEPTANNYKKRPCGKCNEFQTKEGHDPCLGTLPGVVNACCGHGDDVTAYVQFEINGEIVKGCEAITIMNIIKR